MMSIKWNGCGNACPCCTVGFEYGHKVVPDTKSVCIRALDPSRMAMERQREERKEAKEKERRERYVVEPKPRKSASDLLIESRDARLRAKVQIKGTVLDHLALLLEFS